MLMVDLESHLPAVDVDGCTEPEPAPETVRTSLRSSVQLHGTVAESGWERLVHIAGHKHACNKYTSDSHDMCTRDPGQGSPEAILSEMSFSKGPDRMFVSKKTGQPPDRQACRAPPLCPQAEREFGALPGDRRA